MADAPKREPKVKKDTTLLRIARNVGFNARVEPMWHTFNRLRERVGWFQKWRLKKSAQRLVNKINEHLEEVKVNSAGWDRVPGDCVCNLRVAKFGLISELRTYVGGRAEAERVFGWKHFGGLTETDAISIPLDFPEPFTVPQGRGKKPIAVSSSLRLKEELKDMNETLNIEGGFALAKISKIDYLDAKEREIAVYESRFSSLDDFWAKFTYFLLKKLADKSNEHRLPIWLA